MLSLTLYSDPVCPWCWIGKRRIEKALRQLGLENEVSWTLRSYELSDRGASSGTVLEHLKTKYRTDDEGVQAMFERVSMIAAEDGIQFDFEHAISASTFDAHRLIKWAARQGKDRELLERMHRAHFQEAKDLSDFQVLAGLAGELGLDAIEAGNLLKSNMYAEDVERELVEGGKIGVRGVPFLILNDHFVVSGAQTVDVFVRVINQALGTEANKP